MSDPRFWMLAAGIVGAMVLFNWLFDRWDKAKTREAEEAAEAGNRAEWDRRAKERREFLDSATVMRAKVVFSTQFGMVNQKPNLNLSLRVEAPDGAYDVDVEEHVEFVDLPRYAEGSTVYVYVDPKDRQHVALCSPAIADMQSESEAERAKADEPPSE
jgi:hypothetical protein